MKEKNEKSGISMAGSQYIEIDAVYIYRQTQILRKDRKRWDRNVEM